MLHKLKIYTILLIILFSSANYFGQSNNKIDNETTFSIEIDPATFGFNGYGVHARIKPAGLDHSLFGIGAYAMDMPDLLVNLNEKNKDAGWNVRLNQGYGLFFEHHFSLVNNGWFTGVQAGIQEYKIDNQNSVGDAKFTNLLFMGYGGYTWQPFNSGFYLKPWGGIGYTNKISGKNTINNLEYNISPITMFLTLHIGYNF